jgi:hypothetical protein
MWQPPSRLIVIGNHVERSPEDGTAFDFGRLERVVLMGNVVTGNSNFGSTVPEPYDEFNVK